MPEQAGVNTEVGVGRRRLLDVDYPLRKDAVVDVAQHGAVGVGSFPTVFLHSHNSDGG